VLFPIVGRLKDNRYRYQDTEYSLPQHGFARDKKFICVEQSSDALAFELTDDDETFAAFPFHFSLLIRYELREKTLRIGYTVFNPGNSPLYYSIGAHPGFRCPLEHGESIQDYTLAFDSVTPLHVSRLHNGLLTDDTYELPLQDHRLPLSDTLFDNDALVMLNRQIDAVKLISSKSGHGVQLSSAGWPCYGLWSKKGNSGFVCLEPWHGVTDSESSSGRLEEKAWIRELAPWEKHELQHSITVF
jgi:galactose mutarotase-like enzyme